MAKSKFFCIAVEGATTDGREIDGAWIDQMAVSYNPATYTARLNCEHLRGFSPDAPFNAYGSVLALEARDVELALDGKTQKRRGLFAQIDANDQLVAINKKNQKIFTSMEVAPKFAGTDKAYLVGLAVTDSPASLGTEMLKFAAGQGDANPLAARKQDKANLFSAASETTIQLEAEEGDTALGKIASLLEGFASKFTGKPVEEPKPEPTPPAPANDNGLKEFATSLTKAMTDAIGIYATANDAKVEKISTDLAALTSKLEKTDASPFRRDPASGASVEAKFATDC